MQLYRSIWVGVDFSPVSQAALFQAARISGRSRASLRAVHVIDEAMALSLANVGGGGGAGDDDAMLEDFRRRLAAFAAANAPDSEIALEVVVDKRTSGFLRSAEKRHSDLLIVGDPDDDRAGIGQLPKACIQQTRADVLLVRDNGARPFRKILAAIDLAR